MCLPLLVDPSPRAAASLGAGRLVEETSIPGAMVAQAKPDDCAECNEGPRAQQGNDDLGRARGRPADDLGEDRARSTECADAHAGHDRPPDALDPPAERREVAEEL